MRINLLPDVEKRELEKEEIWRKVFIVLIFLLIFSVFLTAVFYYLKIFIVARSSVLNQTLEEELKDPEFQNFQEFVAQANQDLSKIRNFRKEQVFIVPIFEKVSSILPSSLYLTNFSFQKIKQAEELPEIRISGWAETREALFEFKEALEKDKGFKEVYFMPSSWLKPVNVNFSLTFRYDEPD